MSSVSDLEQRDILTGIPRVACGEDAGKPHGSTSGFVQAGDMVVRSTTRGEESMWTRSNRPGKRFYGVLDAGQLLCERRSTDVLCKQREG